MRTIYLTYAEPPSGVYSSQVIDVVGYMNREFDASIRLVAFISLHNFKQTKAGLQKQFPGAVVLPMLPKSTWIGFNTFLLWLVCLLLKPRVIISRNVIATTMALKMRGISSVQKVCFDGRGALAAEWNEYNVGVDPKWKASIDTWERKAVNESDYRIAVSQKLVQYWTTRYGYTGNAYVVIPCTLNSGFKASAATEASRISGRATLGFDTADIVLAYSGSTAGWQSFSLLKTYLSALLGQHPLVKILFLSPEDPNITALEKEVPGRVKRAWVKHQDVPATLAACDYGILIREESITNEVASPTKFAEYLSAGLPVLASAGIGDYSDFIRTHHCGTILKTDQPIPELVPTPPEERNRLINLVQTHFTKSAHKRSYEQLLNALEQSL